MTTRDGQTGFDPHTARAGFQRSENSSAELTIYAVHRGTGPDQQVFGSVGVEQIQFVGVTNRSSEPSLISLNTSKSMGAPSGTWTATVKSGKRDLRELVIDDLWVDIVFKRYGRPYATMRGTVDQIRRVGSVGGTGATSVSYTITGRDFGKIWEKTPIWFNQWANENVVGAAALQVINSLNFVEDGRVDQTVRAFLFGFLAALADKGRANWQMPQGMPGVQAGTYFVQNVFLDRSGFTNTPARVAVSPTFMDPNGAGSWQMAQQWSDPAFCELWADFLPLTPGSITGSVGAGFVFGEETSEGFAFSDENISGTIGAGFSFGGEVADGFSVVGEATVNNDQLRGQQITLEEAAMTVILRDRPFPTLEAGLEGPWFQLPTAIVTGQEIETDSLVRGGHERFNAFFVSPQILQGFLLQGQVDITAPLWDEEDMLVHGMRRFDINSSYVADMSQTPEDGALLTITKRQREKVRDWYCMNPFLWSGSLNLGHGRPDIRVGMRMRVPGVIRELDFTGYVEQVDHSWSFEPGIRTTLGVTRGWVGSDDAYLAALSSLASRYTEGTGVSA